VSFLFPSLLWIGIPLIFVPVLIHLINLRRQQRIRWAAMQFLLASQRNNKKWVRFKQWLLLAARIAAIALLVLMLSHLVVRNEWLRLLGSGTTHHVVLVDDSYSISDRWENTTGLSEAKHAIQAIVDQAGQQSDRQLITLLRFSEAAKLSAGAQPQVFAQPIDDVFRSKLETLLAGWEPSETDVGPADALKAIPRLPLAGEDQSVILYLLSDFRTRQFDSASEIRKQLEDLGQEVAQIHLVRCVREARPNLAITALAPEQGIRAAGVESWMDVTVTNYGDTPARGAVVQLQQDGDALTAQVLDDIPPRKEVTKKFRVQFAGVGPHWISAALPPDAVEVDNHRYFACQLPAAQPVLIIDGSHDGRGARQLSLALDPGGNAHTGWSPHVESPSYLTRREDLAAQAAVCLLDVPKLQEDELASLEDYVTHGGGVAFFVGSDTNRDYYNDRLYHNGAGLFPVPLTLPTQLLDSAHESAPDVAVTDHPLFHALAGRRNGFLPLLMVDYYYSIPADWTAPKDGSVSILARLRNDAPLVVEKSFGDGRVVAQLTKLSTADTPLGRWTNWSLNPVFPVLANELIGYLSASRKQDADFQIGDDLVVSVPESDYDPTFRFFVAGPGNVKKELPIEATSDHGQLVAKLPQIATSGIVQVQLQPREGEPERRAYAFNVPVGEGDLHIISRDDIEHQLAGVNYQLHDAADMAINEQQLAGVQLGDTLLAALIVILIIEQILAYIATFHVQPARGPKS
jgi:aerotolerance regulator-like protein